jgi:hypothetical protein
LINLISFGLPAVLAAVGGMYAMFAEIKVANFGFLSYIFGFGWFIERVL